MSPAPAEQHGTPKPPRPRANTTFLTHWRQKKGPEAASASLSSTPAAPVQTLPLETLVKSLAPPAVPSPSAARQLVTALQTQTPAPAPATLTPILKSLCSPESPPSLQAVGFDILTVYCHCGVTLVTSDRLIYFDLVKDAADTWSSEVWEPRLKVLNALFPSADDVLGVQRTLMRMHSDWLEKAAYELCASPNAGVEKDRVVEVVSEALIGWFNKLEGAGLLSEEEDTMSLFELFSKLVDYTISLPIDHSQISSPPTPARESGVNTPTRHRRHQSSASNLTSPLSNPISPPQVRKSPTHLLSTIYLNFLDSRINRLPHRYLDALLPLLFRMLSTLMSPLSTISPASSSADLSPTEIRVVKAISSLLGGPYTTKAIILLKRHLVPDQSDASTSLGAVRMLRMQIRQVLGDRMAVRCVQRDVSSSATHSGAPSSTQSIDENLILERAKRGWRKEGAAIWDACKISFLLVKAIKAWIAYPSDLATNAAREQIFEEITGILKDVLHEMEDEGLSRNNARDEMDGRNASLERAGTLFNHNDTASAVGGTLMELMNYVKTLQ